MSAVVRTDEWPRRAETVARSTPSASRRLAWLCRRTWSDAPLGRPDRCSSPGRTDGGTHPGAVDARRGKPPLMAATPHCEAPPSWCSSTWQSDRSVKTIMPFTSDHRRAKTSPRLAPVAATTSRNTGCTLGQAILLRWEQCHSDALPHFWEVAVGDRIYGGQPPLDRAPNAEETRPAMFRTVFGFIARGVLDLRVWPPHFSNRVHSRLR